MMKKQIIRPRFLYFKAWPQIYMVFKKTRRSNKQFIQQQANSKQRTIFTLFTGKDNANKIDLTPILEASQISSSEMPSSRRACRRSPGSTPSRSSAPAAAAPPVKRPMPTDNPLFIFLPKPAFMPLGSQPLLRVCPGLTAEPALHLFLERLLRPARYRKRIFEWIKAYSHFAYPRGESSE